MHPSDTMDVTSLRRRRRWNRDFGVTALQAAISDLAFKFSGYVLGQKHLSGNNFGLILKNKMATTAIFALKITIFHAAYSP